MRTASTITVLVLSVTVLAVWLGRADAADHAAFGLPASVLVLTFGMAASVAATICAGRSMPPALRWLLAVVLGVLAGVTAVLGFGHLSRSAGVPESLLGGFLLVIAVALFAGVLTSLRATQSGRGARRG